MADSKIIVPTRAQYMQRWGAIEVERSSFWSHYKELSENFLPRSGRFFITDRNRGEKKHNKIIDSTGTRAVKTLAAGMQAGMTSPARPWFRVGIADKQLAEVESVKQWLNQVTEIMRRVFQKSNMYRALHSVYGELGLFGTSCNIVMDDFKNVIHNHTLTAGEYGLAVNFQGTVNTVYRQFEMPVGALVGEFGIDNCSQSVKNMHASGNLDSWVPVMHLIEPRIDRDPRMKDNQNMPWASLYVELGTNSDNLFLRKSGFKEFPAMAPRWELNPGDIYGGSPGMEALGDAKQLQHGQLRKAQAIDYKVKPPLQVPNSLKSREIDMLPGGISYYDSMGPTQGIKSMFSVDLDLGALLEDINDVRQRINKSFYVDMFLLLSEDDRSDITAREVAERHEEKLLMLGPVLERLNSELLDPTIDITFAKMLQAGLVPPAPKELQGQELNIEYISMLAQAQRAVGTGAVDRLLGVVGAVAQMKPEVLDKLDADQLIDQYSDLLGVDPSLIVADDKVVLIRKDRQQQQAQAQAMAMAQPVADTAKTLADTHVTEDSALSAALNQFSQ